MDKTSNQIQMDTINHLPNIRHKKTITAEDYIFRVNLYAAWIHLLADMIQALAGQWHRFSKIATELPGSWHIQADARRAVGAIQQADKHLSRFEQVLDSVDIAEWRNVRDVVKVHDKEQAEINIFLRFFELYYKDFFGNRENQEKLWNFMETFAGEFLSDSATDVFALNYIYTLNIEK